MISALYVDDEGALLEIGKLFLERGGNFSVDTASSAKDGIELLGKNSYDAVISDYQMPEMDGICFLKNVRENFGNIPFILFTGRGREEIVIEALNNGADFYIQKGGNPKAQFAELKNCLSKSVGKKRAEMEVLRKEAELFEADKKISVAEKVMQSSYQKLIESEKEIRETNQLMTDLVNFLPDATFAIDREEIVIAWNLAMESFSGIPPEEILGKKLSDISLPFYRDHRPLLAQSMLKSKNPDEAGYISVSREGNTLFAQSNISLTNKPDAYAAVTASLFYNTNGEVKGAIESIRDITEYKLGERSIREANRKLREAESELKLQIENLSAGKKALLESEKKYRALYENMAEGSALHEIIYDDFGKPVDYRLLDVNPAYEKILGISRDYASGKSACEVYGVLKPPFFDKYLNVALTGEPLKMNVFYEVMNRYFSISAFSTGKNRFVTVFSDITDEMRTKEALVQSEERLRTLINSTPDIVCFKDEKGRLMIANDAYVRFFSLEGIDYRLNTNSELSLFAHPLLQEALKNCEISDNEAWNLGRLIINEESFLLPEGDKKIFEMLKVPLFHADGSRKGLVVLGRDVTYRKNAEDKLIHANQKLKLLGSITRHDIVNKVTAILSYLSLICEISENNSTQEFTKKIESLVDEIHAEVLFARDYSVIGSADPVWQNLENIMPFSSVPKTVSFNADVSEVEIYADIMLKKIFANLLSNSVMHGGGVTSVNVYLKSNFNNLTIIWEDNGCGIPDNMKEKIFERKVGKNNGFGLFLVREILLLTGIGICETGTENEGARFVILVPQECWRKIEGSDSV
ncbi:PAS domain S-box protein [Methanoplanus sp. FWC-SCC4]|uniref:PAS domain S-box protein n=1 Tax=Methanochimaera problematica TaxID=2609417 RepID=A0AA97FBK2_9EURY|nr:PAS domain S-box protein [Methanoplanus sp. FWC-SCC4]WOF15243.1 PAS domain S-box protein [Methanoplanus sp. FWC-SCC4]